MAATADVVQGHQEPNHGRRSHVSPSRRRAATAHAPQAAMPTVKDMHLQRVATMAAAQATAQATNADMTSHEQFARDLRSYRGQMAGGGVRTPSKPAWDSEPSSGAGLFDEGSSYLPGECCKAETNASCSFPKMMSMLMLSSLSLHYCIL